MKRSSSRPWVLALALAALAVLGLRESLRQAAQPEALDPIAIAPGARAQERAPDLEAPTPAEAESAPAAAGEIEAPAPQARAQERRIAASGGSEDRGSLRFRLVDDRGEALAEAEFRLGPPGARQRRFEDRAARAQDGVFELTDLARGRWQVSATVEGHLPPREGFGGPYSVPWTAAPIEVVFTRAARVSGRVVDGAGGPVAASVRLLSSAHDEDRYHTRTDDSGDFRLQGLRPGPYALVASNDFVETRAEVTLAAGEHLEDLELRLEGGGWIQGRVLDRSGAPAAEVGVIVVDHLDIRTGTTADVEGAFRIGPVSAGVYRVTAVLKTSGDADTFSELLAQEVILAEGEVVDVLLQPALGARVQLTGRVLHAGEPLPRCVVYAMREGVPLLDTVRMARADGEGAYELELDGGGDVLFLFEPRDNPSDSPIAPLRANVPHAARARLDLVVPAGAIAGWVLDPEGGAVAGVRVVAEPADARLDVELPEQQRGVRSGSDGKFQLRYLARGLYTVRVEDAAGEAWAFEPREVRVAEGEQVRLELRASAGGVVFGTVRGPNREPIEGAVVHVFDGEGHLLRLGGALTDADGAWRVAGVRPGRVSVCARAAGLAAPASEERAVEVGAEVRIDLELSPGALLTVVARDRSAAPVSADLRVVDASGRDVTRLVAREGGANFADPISTSRRTVGPLPPGTYTATATAPDGRTARASVRLSGNGEHVVDLEM